MWKKKEVSTEIDPTKKYTPRQLDEIADAWLREDARTEMCRVCHSVGKLSTKMKIEPQYDDRGDLLMDGEGHPLLLQFPEITCSNEDCSHVWYQGEGEAKGIGPKYGPPILFEEHIMSRKRREIFNSLGTPDPEIVSGSYNRSHPQGRKINSKEAREKHGASWYR